MLLSAATELGVDLSGSWMIGDTDADATAGNAAGCRTVLVETPGSHHKRDGSDLSGVRALDLTSAVSIIVRARENG
jgi:D-glycero-D-manno-heptose 1,7-bisphosphate phosphatase